mgnify:CR=1 FL=1
MLLGDGNLSFTDLTRGEPLVDNACPKGTLLEDYLHAWDQAKQPPDEALEQAVKQALWDNCSAVVPQLEGTRQPPLPSGPLSLFATEREGDWGMG